ncbi:HpyAIV family type II restriction enzyme [Mycoplasmopsis fermentans]|uniref:HpyAIV family type II restriction enzyme n=1 Tax=Mycoplasmopsis fermentans TaxID=2115 RepID=UPI0001E33093|nr:hypothetical protein [Mycoplasmopsis fermentans]ADN68883.1 conserved hypothetical protein [Mycoplasmopsis fermentans JER]
MEYSQFETQLKRALTNDATSKLIKEIINKPSNFVSLSNPFDVKTKIKQSFLKHQERIYEKFIQYCAKCLITQYGFSLQRSNFRYNLPLKEGQHLGDIPEQVIINASFIFRLNNNSTKDEPTDMFVVYLRKRDCYSHKAMKKTCENIIKQLEALKIIYPKMNIKGALWFLDNDYIKNIRLFNNFYYEQVDLRPYYGADFFEILDKREDWLKIESFIKKFKEHNQNYFSKMPDLDQSEEALRALLHLEKSEWTKLNSNKEIYRNIKENIFNLNDKNSNLFKAIAKSNKSY